jgi:FdhD protein
MSESVKTIDVERVVETAASRGSDVLAVEEPLEIRVASEGAPPTTVSLTMRTPGDDTELAVGYLFTEGIVRRREEIVGVYPCRSGGIRVELAAEAARDLSRLDRHSYTSSSCGACGKRSTDTLRATPAWPLRPGQPIVDAELVRALPGSLREAQLLFAETGGLHASALFDLDGRLIVLREDVGRHNALDKVVGWAFREQLLPLAGHVLCVSGRLSFELVQKAAVAGCPVLVAVGAPSSLAVDLASDRGITLCGFVRGGSVNVYTEPWRIRA